MYVSERVGAGTRTAWNHNYRGWIEPGFEKQFVVGITCVQIKNMKGE